MNREFFKAVLIRAIKTFCQTAATMVTVGQAFFDIGWVNVLSVSFVSAIYSVLTSIGGGLPEVAEAEEDIFAELQQIYNADRRDKNE